MLHAHPTRDEKGVEVFLAALEGVGQGKIGQDADAVSDGGFEALGGVGVVDVDELEGVVVVAGEDGAEGAEEVERFEVGEEEGEDAVVRGHFSFFFFFLVMKMQRTNGSEFESGGFWQRLEDPLCLIWEEERGADDSRMNTTRSKMRALIISARRVH